jgi:polyphosphate kinase 2 (PPK2 family)
MDFIEQHRIPPGKKVKLKSIDTKESGPFRHKQDAKEFTRETNDKIRQLQYQMFVEGQQSMLVVLQAPDAAGKDGLIRNVLGNLALAGTRMLKFYLHISPQEQLDRFKKRLDDPTKHWKLNVGYYAARDQWDKFRDAYQDAIEKCNTEAAPWYVIPADRKWYRDAAVAGIVHETLKQMDPQLPPVTVDLDEVRALYEREAAE